MFMCRLGFNHNWVESIIGSRFKLHWRHVLASNMLHCLLFFSSIFHVVILLPTTSYNFYSNNLYNLDYTLSIHLIISYFLLHVLYEPSCTYMLCHWKAKTHVQNLMWSLTTIPSHVANANLKRFNIGRNG